jgi:uracil-DNA glycosylase
MNPLGPTSAKVMIVGAQPTINDIRAGRPFAGVSGKELSKMLHEVGFIETECYLTYVSLNRLAGDEKYAFAKNKTEAKKVGIDPLFGKYPKPELLAELEGFNNTIETVRPNLIIALGEMALWATTGQSGITKWRGSVLQGLTGVKVVPTYAPDKILKKWDWRWIAVQDLRRAYRESDYPEIRVPPYKFVIRPNLETVVQWIQNRLIEAVGRPHNRSTGLSPATDTVGTPLLLSVDIETRAGHIECLALATSKLDAICIPLMTRDSNDGYWKIEEEILIVKLLTELLTHEYVEVVGQNFLYDAQYIAKHWGFIPNVKHDTMIEHHVCFSGLQKSLDFLSSIYCDFHRFWKEDAKGYDPNITDDDRWIYNCRDAVITYECHDAIQMTLAAFELEDQAAMQMRLFLPLLRMMLRGTRIDMKKRDKMGPELMDAIASRELLLIQYVGDLPAKPKTKTAKPWYRSSQQLAKFLYETLGLPQQRHIKTGRPTTNDAALQKLRKKEPALTQFFDTLTELRSLGVFYSTFVRAPLDPDNRIRCSFNPAGTETYRLSSSSDAFGYGTNLQNIPKGNEL